MHVNIFWTVEYILFKLHLVLTDCNRRWFMFGVNECSWIYCSTVYLFLYEFTSHHCGLKVISTLKSDFHILPKRPGVSACRRCVSLIGPCSLSLEYDWLSTSMPDWTWLHQSRARQDDKRAGTRCTKRSRPSVLLRLTHDFCYDKDILNNYFETKIPTYFLLLLFCVWTLLPQFPHNS